MDSIRVLILEEGLKNSAVVRQMLCEQEFVLIAAQEEGASVAAGDHARPDCVVIDGSREIAEGLGILEKLEFDSALQAPAIVMLTDGDDTAERLALQKGAHECLPADRLDAESLRRTILRAMARRNRLTQLDFVRRKLTARDARLRSIVDDQAEIISLSLADGTLTYVNMAFARAFGRAAEDLEGSNLYDLVPETDREFVRRMRASLAPDRPVVTHRQRIAADGSSRWLEWTNRLLQNKDGGPAEYRSTGRDITERKLAEDALRRRREGDEAIINTAMDAIISVDDEQRIILFNPAAAALFRYPARDAIGKSLDLFIPQRFRATHAQHVRRFGVSGQTTRNIKSREPIVALRSDGVEVSVDASISMARVDGRMIYSVILRDVTARTQAEKALRESDERFRNLIATVPGVIFTFFQDGAGRQSIPYASPNTRTLLGLDPEQLKHDFQLFFRFVHPDDLDHFFGTIVNAVQTRGPWREEFRYLHPEKGLIWLEGQSAPDTDLNKGLLWHGYLRDVTIQKASQARVKELAAGRIKTIKAMAAGLAHELNQPLTAGVAFLGSARQLVAMPPESRPVSVEQTLSNATEQIVRAAGILTRLREFIAHSEPNKTGVKLHDLIQTACLLTGDAAKQNRIGFRLELGAGNDDILADAVQLEQALVSLLRNAIDAIGDGKKREIILTTSSNENEIGVDIAVSQISLPAKAVVDLLAPCVTAKASGMGVGLLISRSVIEAHGGTLTATSNAGKGATLSFTIPLKSRHEPDGQSGALKSNT